MNFVFGTPYHGKTIAECRAIGRYGGRTRARNLRLRRLQTTASQEPAQRLAAAEETATEASAILDRRFPWLRNAWVRPSRRPAA